MAKGYRHTEETKRKISLAGKKRFANSPGTRLGVKLTEEQKHKMSLAHVGLMLGDKHWNWQGGKRGKDYLERRRFQKTMQQKVFERDGYKCVLCGKGGNLQVDHIQKWSEFEELRFDIDNCRTLCAQCHYQLTFNKPMPDSIRGWGHNLLRGGILP